MDLPNDIIERLVELQQELSIAELASEYSAVVSELRAYDPVQTAASFGALLTLPELQANCYRIEALVHLAMAYCSGRKRPNTAFIQRCFRNLSTGRCAAAEDPAEDVFVSLVSTQNGNFRIFEGIREGTGFYLQRLLEVLEQFPACDCDDGLQRKVQALLKLSDAVAERSGVRDNCLGAEFPVDRIPRQNASRIRFTGDCIRFSNADLAMLGISPGDLADLVFQSTRASDLRRCRMGNSDIEKRPLARQGESIHVLLPTAIATAISRLVIAAALRTGSTESFERLLTQEYGRLLSQTRVLGFKRFNPFFQRVTGGYMASGLAEVDRGRFIHLIYFVDSLDGFDSNGLAGTNPHAVAVSHAVEHLISQAVAQVQGRPDFRTGMTLFVGCGYGRGFSFDLEDSHSGWHVEGISGYDLETLNWLEDFDALSLWRLLDSRQVLERSGIELVNPNGLLNLVAWSRKQGGHLVPHGSVPDSFGTGGGKNVLVIEQNGLRLLRHEVNQTWDPRNVQDHFGRWVGTRRLNQSRFEIDKTLPLYGSIEDVQAGVLRGVYLTSKRRWWVEITAPDDAPHSAAFQCWVALCMWVARSAPLLDVAYAGIPTPVIAFSVNIAGLAENGPGETLPESCEELRTLVKMTTDRRTGVISLNLGTGLNKWLSHHNNVAERAIVDAMVRGVAQLAGEGSDQAKQAKLSAEICPNGKARHIYRIQAKTYRDYVCSGIQQQPECVNELDHATPLIGLGWRVRRREDGADIYGVKQCTSYLNSVVQVILDDLYASLRSLDRRSLVTAALNNHELACYSRDTWLRAAEASLALHSDQAAIMRTIEEQQARLNGCFVACRILIEAGICECPVFGGEEVGRLDLSRAMALALLAHRLGGWSDAVYWNAMDPHVRVRPAGDVHMDQKFITSVYEPFGRQGGEYQIRLGMDSFRRRYWGPEHRGSFTELLHARFLEAWKAEFGVSLPGTVAFAEDLERMGLESNSVVFDAPRSLLVQMLASSSNCSAGEADSALGHLTLQSRPYWREAPCGFSNKDWFPWRFRRRLSVLRRPLLQIDDSKDPTVICAPGLVRDGLLASASWFYTGEIPPSQARSREMCRWIGHANNTQRSEFNLETAVRMREFGWHADAEVKLTKLFGRPLDRDYGDIDVLAWQPGTGRVLVMECKDLQFLKTLGEVAEQLSDFRGVVGSDGKPDHLKRHLNRLDVLTANQETIAERLSISGPVRVEGHLVFKNPVPMAFAWEHMAGRIRVTLLDQLASLQ